MPLKLLMKELRLCSNVQLWIFFALGPLMMFIPGYPRYVGGYYLCVGVFLLFALGAANHDILYTASLPVTRDDIIRARFLFIAVLELLQTVLCIPMSLVTRLLSYAPNAAGIDSNVAYCGLQLVVFTAFNLVFLPNAYNKGESKNGLPFLVASVVYWVAYAVAELPIWMGTRAGAFLDAVDAASQVRQIPVLLGGGVAWALGLLVAFVLARKKFRRVSL